MGAHPSERATTKVPRANRQGSTNVSTNVSKIVVAKRRSNSRNNVMTVVVPTAPAIGLRHGRFVIPALTPAAPTTPAVARGFEELRREQLMYADKVARDPKQTKRWESVLFHVSGLDSVAYPEACFWRAVAHYRLGEIARGDAAQASCGMSAVDALVIERERTEAAARQPPALIADLEAAEMGLEVAPRSVPAHSTAASPVRDETPYGGAGPSHLVAIEAGGATTR